MDAVTYPNAKVSSFIYEYFIPIRVDHNAVPLSTDYNVHWTPTLIVLDVEGKEHYRSLGFLPSIEFIPALMLGIARLYFDSETYTTAIAMLDKVLSHFPKSTVAPEAVYYHGVSTYKSTHEAKWLKAIYQRISIEYPNSEWEYRSSPYRLLKLEK
jgi:hypothetical protein